MRNRMPGIERLSNEEKQSVKIVAIQSGTVRGSIDLNVYPDAYPQIQIGDVTYTSELLDEDRTFEIRGVPAGKHEVLISGNRRPLKIPGREYDGAFTTSIIKRVPVIVRPGKVARADVDGDRK